MSNLLIFLPEKEVVEWKGVVYGVVVANKWGTAVYVIGNQCGKVCKNCLKYEVVGCINSRRKCQKSQNEFWINVIVDDEQVVEVSTIPGSVYNLTVIMYNMKDIKQSHLLDSIPFQESDFVHRLLHEVKQSPNCHNTEEHSITQNQTFLNFFLFNLMYILMFLKHKRIKPILEISSFGLHLFVTLETSELLMHEVKKKNKMTVPFLNYIFVRILDCIIGFTIISWLIQCSSSTDIFSKIADFQEYIVVTLENTVQWLMGSPAGFKLNCPLNNVLGPFYQFHISMWGTFLKLSNPMLRMIFKMFLFLGSLGFSFQVALLADILATVTVHIYCIYVYASRLYHFQIKGLRILFGLFIGKNRNPLPGKNASLPYTTEQLLFGTVSFTVLLFLLPTTLIYYAVFTAIRIVLIFLGGILTRLRYLMNVFPLYITWLWLVNPLSVTCTVRLSTSTRSLSNGTLVTKIRPVCKSWKETVALCTPASIKSPESIEWKKLTFDVLVGNLIYPV